MPPLRLMVLALALVWIPATSTAGSRGGFISSLEKVADSLTNPKPLVEISLGLRDNTVLFPPAPIDCPLAFVIKNVGQRGIEPREIPQLFFAGRVHLRSDTGLERQCDLARSWRTS